MADVSKLRLDNVTYDIKDDNARKYLVMVNEEPVSATKVIIETGEEDGIELALQEDVDNLYETTLQQIKVYNDVTAMQADFVKSDRICKVLDSAIEYEDSKTYKPSRANYYKYSNTNDFGYALSNGGYANLIIPEFSPSKGGISGIDALPLLLNTAYSYCGVTRETPFTLEDGTQATNIRYQTSSGPYANEAGLRGIQCSQFVHAVIRGLNYDASRLADSSNVNAEEYGGSRDFYYNGTDLNTLSASQMAYVLASKGQFKETRSFNEVEIGDILFFGPIDDGGVQWRGIGHTGIVVGKTNNGVMIAQAGSTPSMSGFNRSRVRPGFENDAVNFDFILHMGQDFADDTYAMKGFGRVNYNFPKKPISDTQHLLDRHEIPEAYAEYGVGGSITNIHIYKEGDQKAFKFGVISWKGYTSRKNSGVGFRIYRTTVGSTFPATGVEMTTSSALTTGCVMPVLFNCDANIKIVTCALIIQTNTATASDAYLIRDFVGEFYK